MMAAFAPVLAAVIAETASPRYAHREPPYDRCSLAPGPSPVSNFLCEQRQDPTRFAVHVTGEVTSADVDYVSIEVATTQAPIFGSYAPADVLLVARANSDSFSAVVPLAEKPRFALVRAHSRGCAEDAGNGTWSSLVNVTCAHIAPWEAAERVEAPSHKDASHKGALDKDALHKDLPKPATHWLEVYRMAEQSRLHPDFLDNHDSGDSGGVGGLISISVQNNLTDSHLFATPVTRYCVEVLNVTISGTTTTTQSEDSPATSQYADYRSTNPLWDFWQKEPWYRPLIPFGEVTAGVEYASWCALFADRTIAQLAKRHVSCCDTNESSPTYQNCAACCSNASAAASRKHVGMSPVGLPLYATPHPAVGVYSQQLPPIGVWFSHPSGGRCPFGVAVGERGCTWQRAPLAHSVFVGELLGRGGMNRTLSSNASGYGEAQSPAQMVANVDVFRKTWAQKGLPPCGEGGREIV